MYLKRSMAAVLLWMLIYQSTPAQKADFSHAVIFSPGQDNAQLQEAVVVLQQVIKEHSNILLPVVHESSVQTISRLLSCAQLRRKPLCQKLFMHP